MYFQHHYTFFIHVYIIILQNHQTDFNQTWHNASLGDGNQIYLNEGPRPFPKGDNYELAKLH